MTKVLLCVNDKHKEQLSPNGQVISQQRGWWWWWGVVGVGEGGIFNLLVKP